MNFTTEEGRSAYEDECLAARAGQTVLFAIAPRITSFALPSGRVVKAGDEVKASDFEGSYLATKDGNGREVRHAVPAWKALRDAVADGRVLEADLPEQTANDR